jgi:hypothetical protein
MDQREQALQGWVETFKYGRYRNYPAFSPEHARKVFMDSVQDEGPDARKLWLGDEASPSGLLRVVDLKWDERIYKVKMGYMTHCLGPVSPCSIREALAEAGYSHVVTRVDASNFALQRRLLQEGFFLADTLVTYITSPLSDPVADKKCPALDPSFVIRDYEPKDREGVLEVTERMYGRYPSRYYRDPFLREHSAERYTSWMEKYLDGEADKTLVAEQEGKVTAFLSFKYDRRLHESTQILCYGAGIGASSAQGRGAYSRLLYDAIVWAIGKGSPYSEFDTQIDNYGVLRLYHQLALRYVRAQHTFHLYLPPLQG